MKTIKIGSTDVNASAVGLGCMRISQMGEEQLAHYLDHCVSLGINFFDHADIYGDGECERIFGRALKKTSIKRSEIIIQSKCGIVPGKMYDMSREHIISSVDNILSRLQTDYLDFLLLHRPDALIEPEEVARAFDELKSSGKVRNLGVSNFRPMQIDLLKRHLEGPLSVCQMQLSLPHSLMISQGLEANMTSSGAADRTGDIIDYCRLNGLTIQAWSPFSGRNGSFIEDNSGYPDLNWVLGELSGKYGVTKTTIAAAWILRHPANIQLLSGTTNFGRIADIAKATNIELSREEWYKLYLSAGHILP